MHQLELQRKLDFHFKWFPAIPINFDSDRKWMKKLLIPLSLMRVQHQKYWGVEELKIQRDKKTRNEIKLWDWIMSAKNWRHS